MKRQNGYGNIKVFSPDNILMFLGSKKRLKFYLDNDLIEDIGDNSYRLKMTPKGLGHSGEDRNQGLLDGRENRCVVSGDTDLELMNRHHIVPSMYRVHFPEKIKSNNFQFVVMVRHDLHDSYTKKEQKFHDEVAKMFGVPTIKETLVHFLENGMPFKIAKTLAKHGGKIPKENYEYMKAKFEGLTGQELTKEMMEKYAASGEHRYRYSEYSFGKLIVNQITDFKEFEMLWLRHFIETMKPKFLPEDLKLLL